MTKEEKGNKTAKIIAKAWADEEYKKKLLADPTGTLKAEGIEVPQDHEVRIVEDTNKVSHMILPPKPAARELTDEQLDRIAGGGCCMIAGSWDMMH